jgi:hypothetical protein
MKAPGHQDREGSAFRIVAGAPTEQNGLRTDDLLARGGTVMFHDWLNAWLHVAGGRPCFRIYGKGRREKRWRIVHVYATHRRDGDSRWPLWRGTCTTWSAEVIAVGWDFAAAVLREQAEEAASPARPVAVVGGRIGDPVRRCAAGGSSYPSASEVLAHECGHTWQASRLGPLYLPLVGAVTFFREGPRPWNRFENEASEQGLFGGLVGAASIRERIRAHTTDPCGH